MSQLGSESDKKHLTKSINDAAFNRGDKGNFHFTNPIENILSGNYGTTCGTIVTRPERTKEESPSTSGTTKARPKRTVKKESPTTSATTGAKRKRAAKKVPSASRSRTPKRRGLKTAEIKKVIEKDEDLSCKDKENLFLEEKQKESSDSSSSEANENDTEDCIQLSDSIWMFPDKRISTHREIYEGELRSRFQETRTIVLKLVENIPQGITEARILAKLNHHLHVLSLIQSDIFNCGFYDQIYIALDKCHHENLREFVTNRKNQGFAFNLSRAMKIAEQMVDGVKYIHENRIIHKDLEPDKILFSLDQRLIKIAGFGLSREIDSTLTEVFEMEQFGTNGFRPPESFGRAIISQKSDIFSLGVICYFVLSNGEHPFGEDPDGWNYHIKNGIIDLSGLPVPNIKTTEHLVKSMIEHKINDRPTIWQVSEHPFWTGNEVSCDFDYHCPESVMSLIPPTSEQANHNIADIYELLEHVKKVKLRDETTAAKAQSKAAIPRLHEDMEMITVIQKCVRDLEHCDGHPILPHQNVAFIQVHGKYKCRGGEQDDYCTITKLPRTLTSFLEEIRDEQTLKIILLQLAHAVHYIHENGWAHGEIDLTKIYLPETEELVVLMMSTKIYKGKRTSVREQTKDIKDLQKVFNAILTMNSQTRIQGYDIHVAENLLQVMQIDATRSKEILRHPYFWDAERKLNFLSKITQFSKAGNVGKPMKDALNAKSRDVFGIGGWKIKLEINDYQELDEYNKNIKNRDGLLGSALPDNGNPPQINQCQENHQKRKKKKKPKLVCSKAIQSLSEEFNRAKGKPMYDGNELQSLLNFIRNRWENFWEDSLEVQACFGYDYTTGFWKFFSRRFPRLFPVVYAAAKEQIEERIEPRICDIYFNTIAENKNLPKREMSSGEAMEVDTISFSIDRID